MLVDGAERAASHAAAVPVRLLAWYDRHARRLPWRSPPGAAAPDPYRVWLSEVMLQQTTVAAVAPRFARFLARWPSVAALAAAPLEDVLHEWAGLGYYARARNLHACSVAVAAAGGFPDSEAALRALPGVGDYTAAAVAAIAFGRRAVVVDGNVERVVARLFAVAEPLPRAKATIRRLADTITPDARPGDFAQAMMDLGATICTPRNPACALCPLREGCAGFAGGRPEAFPVKPARGPKPQRFGTAFGLMRGGEVLLVRRPARGLLGGLLALPTGPWTDVPPGLEGAPAEAAWRLIDARVDHVFTHFRLSLALAVARLPAGMTPSGVAPDAIWWQADRIDEAGLPTLFARAAARLREDA